MLRFEPLDARLMLSVTPGDTVVTFNVTVAGQPESFQVELFNSAAPQTVANFLNYVNSGAYDNTFFHRIVDDAASATASAFQIVQGGGFSAAGAPFSIYSPVNGPTHIDTSHQSSLPNEYSSTLPDSPGTLAMALTSDSNGTPVADSGTSEWFFNVSDNSTALSPAQQQGVGYAVFGQLLGNGLSIVTQIDQLSTLNDLAGSDTSGYISNVYDNLSSADQSTVASLASTPLSNFNLASPAPITINNLVILNSVNVTVPTVGGTVYGDLNDNGTQDAGDQGAPNVTVYLDSNNNGQLDPGETSTATNASGQYTLQNVPDGTAVIRALPPPNWTLTTPASQSVTVTNGQASGSANFGMTLTLAAPLAPVLPSQFDSGASHSDQLTNLTTLGLTVSGVQSGATVQLIDTNHNNAVIGSATANGSSVTITNSVPLSEGTHAIAAMQTLAGFASPQSAAASVVIDTTAPQITSGMLPDATVGAPYASTVTSNDNGALFSLGSAPSGLQIGPGSGVLTWAPTSGQVGFQQVTVVVTDPAGNTSQKTLSVGVDGPPQFAAIADQSVNQGDTLVISPTVTSIDTPLTYSLAQGAPQDATIDPQTGQFTWTPTAADAAGLHQITINVSDASGQTASSGPINILVTAPPVFAPIPDQTVDEQTTLSVPYSITDPGQVTLSIAGAAPAGAAVASTGTSPGPGTLVTTDGVFTWTPSEAQGPGVYTILLKATGDSGLAATESFQVTVNEVDSPPVFTPPGAITVKTGTSSQIQVTAQDPDLPAQQLVYSLDPGAPQGAVINPQTGLITWSVPANFATGTTNIPVRATEVGGQGLSATESVAVTVQAGLTGFDLYTSSGVELGPFALGVAIDTGFNANGSLSLTPFGSTQPGGLPAQPAALQQLAGMIPAGSPSIDAGAAGHLAAGIVDMVIGFDSGIPHNIDGMELELARYGGSSGGGQSDQGQPSDRGEVQPAGRFETFDDNRGADSRNDSSQIQRSGGAAVNDSSRLDSFWASPEAWWTPELDAFDAEGEVLLQGDATASSNDSPQPAVAAEPANDARISQQAAAVAAILALPLLGQRPGQLAREQQTRNKRAAEQKRRPR
ncbi:MAG TPA: peptidylprolyl isomerase [Pirellulales bacterium]|jgi:cyclophilin family peptidyl-prolyl cis-trans isomerase